MWQLYRQNRYSILRIFLIFIAKLTLSSFLWNTFNWKCVSSSSIKQSINIKNIRHWSSFLLQNCRRSSALSQSDRHQSRFQTYVHTGMNRIFQCLPMSTISALVANWVSQYPSVFWWHHSTMLCCIGANPVDVRRSGRPQIWLWRSHMACTPTKISLKLMQCQQSRHQERLCKPRKGSKWPRHLGFAMDTTGGAYCAPPGQLAGGEGNVLSPRTPHLLALWTLLFGPSGFNPSRLAIPADPHNVADESAPMPCWQHMQSWSNLTNFFNFQTGSYGSHWLAKQQCQKHRKKTDLPNPIHEILIVFHSCDVVIVSFELNVRIDVTGTPNSLTQH